jgi:hypothetical protein
MHQSTSRSDRRVDAAGLQALLLSFAVGFLVLEQVGDRDAY